MAEKWFCKNIFFNDWANYISEGIFELLILDPPLDPLLEADYWNYHYQENNIFSKHINKELIFKMF
ncbi:hypothetical protein C3V39_01845 [Prevotella sp. oral taxon 820]|nr:hypothetical protein C3V39_01845 [Prevotella sp. oral taxon 820]